jgi:DNA-binding transcriptional LysR family regulator
LHASIGTRSSSLTNLASAVKGGLGIAPLPCIIGDAETDLVRCFPPIAELTTELWLVIRADVRQAPHVRAFADFLAAHMRARL